MRKSFLASRSESSSSTPEPLDLKKKSRHLDETLLFDGNVAELTQSSQQEQVVESTLPASITMIVESEEEEKERNVAPSSISASLDHILVHHPHHSSQATPGNNTSDQEFLSILFRAGICWDDQSRVFSFSSSFSRTQITRALRKELQRNEEDHSPRMFILSMDAFLSSSDANLKACLLPLDSDSNLLQLLMKIDILQAKVLQKILELFLFYALEDHVDFPKRLLATLCWLDFVLHPIELTQLLLETLNALKETENKWLADCAELLPEILPDSCHGEAVLCLMKILQETRDHSAALISTLSDLAIPTVQLQCQLVDTVLEVLPCKPVSDIPVILHFILSASAGLNVDMKNKVWISIRRDLAYLSKVPKKSEQEASSSHEALVIRTLHLALRTFPTHNQTFLVTLATPAVEPTLVDVWIFFCFLQNASHQDGLKRLIVHEEQNGFDVFKRAILGHRAALEECGMDAILEFASDLLRMSPSFKRAQTFRTFASFLMQWLFQTNATEDLRVKQEVVHQLVFHACQQQEEEVNAALHCLDRIVCESHKNAMAGPFSSTVRSLLNDLDRFTLDQARILIRVVSRLSIANDSEGMDELKIFLRKFLLSDEEKRQGLGIVGSIQLACCLSHVDVRECMQLIDHMLRETLNALTFEELARSSEKKEFAPQVVDMLNATLGEAFMEWFMFEPRSSSNMTEDASLFGLVPNSSNNTHAESRVNIAMLMVRARHDQVVKRRMELLCPMLRCLLATCVTKTPEILLTCALRLPRLDDSSLAKEFISSSYCIACNWIRETVSSFARKFSLLPKENKSLLVLRLNTLVEAQQSYFFLCPAPGTKKTRQKKKMTTAQKKEEEVEDEEDEDEEEEEEEDPRRGRNNNVTKPFSHFRNLSPLSLSMLSLPEMSLSFSTTTREEGMVAPKLHIHSLKLVLESTLFHLDALSQRKRVAVEMVDNLSLNELCTLLRESAFPALRRFFQQLCARLGSESEETSAAVANVVELMIALWTALLKSAPREEFILMMRSLLGPENADDNNDYVVCAEVSHFLVHHIRQSPLLKSHLQIHVALCVFLRTWLETDGPSSPAIVRDKNWLSEIALELLKQKEWRSSLPLGGKRTTTAAAVKRGTVGVLLQVFHECSSTPLVNIALTVEALTACAQGEDESAVFPLLSLKTLPIFYFSTLASITWFQTLDNNNNDEDNTDNERLLELVSRFSSTIALTKYELGNAVNRDAIRFGRLFVDQFVKKNMPQLSLKLKREQDFVMEVLVLLQKATRQLQNLCSHGKFTKDPSVLASAPALRRSLESFLCSIKGMLKENNCLEKAGFFVGVLKARNLDGTIARAPPSLDE